MRSLFCYTTVKFMQDTEEVEKFIRTLHLERRIQETELPRLEQFAIKEQGQDAWFILGNNTKVSPETG